MSLLEREGDEWIKDLLAAKQKHHAIRVGITGPPGAGKSTLISGLIREYRKQNLKIGVIAVDPSSPFSKGAILGDRIRYSEHFEDVNVFIRSVGSRGAMGGISGSVYLMLRAFDLWKFDLVLVETVGVGQTELDVMNVADQVAVVVVPEFGDSIQALKAGILEIANIFVVNKADRPGADVIVRELDHWAAEEKIPVLKTVATDHEGVAELAKLLNHPPKNPNPTQKLQAEAIAILRLKFEEQATKKSKSITKEKDILTFLNSFNLNSKNRR